MNTLQKEMYRLCWQICFSVFLVMFSTLSYAQTLRTLAVTGTAQQTVSPDAFTMNFSFEQKGQDLVSIKTNVDKQVQHATTLLLDKNVQESNIRSMDVTVYPWIERKQSEQINKGFVYRRTIYFSHDNIEAFDSIIKKIASLSPSHIGQFSLINQNIDSLKTQLNKQALKNARIKAEEMAAVMGMEVGHVLFMSDGTSVPEHMFERKGQMLMADAAQEQGALAGQNQIKSDVQVVFEVHTVSSKPQN
jgi:uncharacterized protein YggE